MAPPRQATPELRKSLADSEPWMAPSGFSPSSPWRTIVNGSPPSCSAGPTPQQRATTKPPSRPLHPTSTSRPSTSSTRACSTSSAGPSPSTQWLRVFAQCARGPTPDDHYGGYGMKVLREVSRAVRPDNGLEIIYEPVVHPAAPFTSEGGRDDVYSENAHKFWVASIRNTAFLDYLYFKLPTVAQYMWLRAVMPGEPQWYRGVIGTEEYIESLRVCDTYAQVH
ncbi:uncharacterized protein TRAVEDRAFT_31806 [Trametes versicolor FP-101664 SS1]|uniref:uncharacterized protein n=1 Tax=Trametes versicolor (strain FP-101664) TaxID=717944 RepID=UPI0004621876|nr:uncharacterized protein TRAVEDRAFT_31806 [Trametes versicolor FP-101664 SS1]EIW52641.1 hypothetical protein TRAVEDRAFT_31806 [Trametes versicolor FP-101664 SS1]